MSRRLSATVGVAEAAGRPSLSRTNIFTGKGPLGWMPDVAPRGPHCHPSIAAETTCRGPTLSPPRFLPPFNTARLFAALTCRPCSPIYISAILRSLPPPSLLDKLKEIALPQQKKTNFLSLEIKKKKIICSCGSK